MSSIKLKNKNGTEQDYTFSGDIKVPHADGSGLISFSPSKRPQSKTVVPSESRQIIAADKGYELSFVTVDAIQVETKTATANGTVTATSGKYMTNVIVNIPEYDGAVE